MFGWRRKRATKFAIDSLRPFVGTIQLHGMPPGFWLDPYILGFFHFMISHRLKLATLSGLAGEEMGFALTETFTAISNMNGIAIANRGLELLTARDPEYYRGADDASAISYYLLRVLRMKPNTRWFKRPLVWLVLRAKRWATGTKSTP